MRRYADSVGVDRKSPSDPIPRDCDQVPMQSLHLKVSAAGKRAPTRPKDQIINSPAVKFRDKDRLPVRMIVQGKLRQLNVLHILTITEKGVVIVKAIGDGMVGMGRRRE